MGVGKIPDEGEAEAGAASGLGTIVIEPDEAIPDPIPLVGRHAWAVVHDADHRSSVLVENADLNGAIGIAQGVVDQVRNDSAELRRICQDNCMFELPTLEVDTGRSAPPNAVSDHAAHLRWLAASWGAPIETGQLKEVVHQTRKTAMTISQLRGQNSMIDRLGMMLGDFQSGQDSGNGSSEFMSGVSYESSLALR